MAERVSTRLTVAQGRKFGVTLGVAFGVLTAILLWRDHRFPMWITGALGAGFLLGGLIVPTWLGPVERAWMAMAHAISKVTTPIVMGIVYFVVVAPIGVVMRVLGKNPLRHQGTGGSLWVTRSDHEGRGGMQRQF